jgi:anti-sigma factor RsiW
MKADMTASDEMACQELVELVTEYLEGTLPAEERARFEAHLAGCRHCRAYLEQMRQTIATLGRLTEDSLDPNVKEDLLLIFRAWKRS